MTPCVRHAGNRVMGDVPLTETSGVTTVRAYGQVTSYKTVSMRWFAERKQSRVYYGSRTRALRNATKRRIALTSWVHAYAQDITKR